MSFTCPMLARGRTDSCCPDRWVSAGDTGDTGGSSVWTGIVAARPHIGVLACAFSPGGRHPSPWRRHPLRHPERFKFSGKPRQDDNGTQELWVFDPQLAGPTTHGGPFRIRLWRRTSDDSFDRIYAGQGPVWSPAVNAWLIAVEEGRSLAIAEDEQGSSRWMTGEEAERAAKEAERAAKEDALRRLDAMQKDLEGRSPDPGTSNPSDRTCR